MIFDHSIRSLRAASAGLRFAGQPTCACLTNLLDGIIGLVKCDFCGNAQDFISFRRKRIVAFGIALDGFGRGMPFCTIDFDDQAVVDQEIEAVIHDWHLHLQGQSASS